MSKRTAAATSGPARQPRPASSAPATQRTPSRRSWAKSLEPEDRRRLGLALTLGLAAWAPAASGGAATSTVAAAGGGVTGRASSRVWRREARGLPATSANLYAAR